MPIAFEHVSYSYDPPAKRGRKPRGGVQADGEQTSASGPSKPSAKTSRPAWGNAPDAVWALCDISFTLADGEFFGIAGHTGSGKSTLIQHMNGLIHPTAGRVLVDGQDMANKRAAAAARGKVGLVFQYPEHQLFAATIFDDVAFGPRNLGLAVDEVESRVRKACAQVGLDFEKVRDTSPFQLSGGQQRRAAFAGVLAMDPSTLVLDEPLAGLDPAARADFLDLIAGLHRGGLTVVMASHDMDGLARLCDRILVLREGEAFALGTPAEVFVHAEELKAIGLGLPAAQRFAANLKKAGVPLGEGLFDIDRLAAEIATLYQARE